MMNNPVSDMNTTTTKNASLWRIFVMLTLPTVLIIILITIFIALRSAIGGHDAESSSALVSEYISYVFIFNLTVVFCVLLRFLHKDKLKLADIGFRLPDNGTKGLIAEVTLAIVSTIIVVGLLINLMPFFESVQADAPKLVEGSKKLGDDFLLALFSAVFVASFVEESIFRGYVITVLRRRWGQVIAILISTLFFGLYHISYGVAGVFRTMFQGLVFALLFARSHSLLGPMLAHSLTNLIGTLLTFDVLSFEI